MVDQADGKADVLMDDIRPSFYDHGVRFRSD